ncbi:MAG: ATP-binding cassette domain-containing protein [Pelagimonas sp.]
MSIIVEQACGGHRDFEVGAIDLSLEKGKLTALIGPNGCGKSTFLSLLAGLLPLHSGRVTIGDCDIAKTSKRQLSKRLTLLPQHPVAPTGLTVAQLVHYGRAPHQNMLGMRCAVDNEIVDQSMQTAGVYVLRNRLLSDLSGGQRQRVFIAMGLAQDTPYFLLDEPTSFLDVRYQFEILDLLSSHTRAGRACIVVLHDIAQAARYADTLVIMKGGTIAAQGAPKSVLQPALLRSVYGIDAYVYSDPVSGTPVVTLASKEPSRSVKLSA